MSVMKFLDIEGLSTFLNQIKNKFVSKENVDSSLSSSSTNPVQNKVINTALNNKVDKVSGKQLSTNDYTTTEKNKLAGIASGAEVNQNAYANIKVGSTTIAADAKSDTLELVAGTNVTLTPDTTNDKVTITAKDTTYSAATQSTAGLMSATDKKKLDGIASNANNYTHPSTHPASMITQDSTHRFVTDVEKQTYADKYTKNEINNKLSSLEKNTDWKEAVETYDDIETTYPSPEDGWTVNVNDTDITYRYDGTKWIAISANSIPLATSSLDGRMSKTDKAKLDGIASGANKYIHPSYTSRTSGLYKVTVDSTGHVSGATAVAKSDITALGIPAQDTTYGAAGSSLGLVKSGGDVTISNGTITVNDDSHAHTIANIDGLQTALNGKSPTTHTHNYAGSSSAGGVANSAVKLSTARTITLGGDLSGSTTFDGSGNVTLTATVKDDTHNHTIANVDGLQDALDNITAGSVSSASKWTTARNINGMSVDGTANRFNYGTCSTAAGTAAKTVACTGFTLATGSEITVKFTVTNTAANPTLNVNSTGAKAVYYNGAAISAGYLKANKTYTFRYNGTQYDLVGDIDTNTTYSLSSFGVTATAAELNKLDGVTATATELNYVDGVTSNIQTQLNGKLSTSGTAAKAIADANGQNIADTYIKALSVSGRTITYTKGDGGTGTITTQDTNTDTKVTQTNTTTNADYRVVLSTNANDTTETNTLRKSVNFQANPSTGAFYAKGYDIIDLTGKTQDLDDLTLSSGSPMKMLYIEKTNGGAANITNSPVEDTPFLLEVELLRWASATDYITLQTFRSTDFLTNGDYVRACVSGTWREWTRRPNTYSLSSFGITATAAELNKLDGVTATATELNYVHGVTSNIQTQLNGKLSTNGTAAKATADSAGQNIADTYIKGLSVSGRTITYTKGDGGTGTITTQDTTYTHPNSGVTAGTYKSVTVNAQGHVTAGLNPTTLAGYGITDACKIVYQTAEPTSGLVKNMVWIG